MHKKLLKMIGDKLDATKELGKYKPSDMKYYHQIERKLSNINDSIVDAKLIRRYTKYIKSERLSPRQKGIRIHNKRFKV